MRVLMIPTLEDFGTDESGIKRVIENYVKYSQEFGIEFVKCQVEDGDKYDVLAVHAGSSDKYNFQKPIVAMVHGLYWTADYPALAWEHKANNNVVYSLRAATKITVPSEWVAETIRRDMRIDPVVIGHGVNWQEWEHDLGIEGYVLWNKNRNADVCDPQPVADLAKFASDVTFITTFKPEQSPENVKAIGVIPHKDMKVLIQRASVYLSVTKETFGIGTLEALSAGTPVLGFAYGGNLISVQHGINGYLAKQNDIGDLYRGLKYCLEHRDILSKNAKITARKFSWRDSVEKVARTYEDALAIFNDKQRPHRL